MEGVIDVFTTPAWLPKQYSTGYFIHMVTHPDINPVQQSLTSVNRREPVFPYGDSRTNGYQLRTSKSAYAKSTIYLYGVY